MQERGLYFLAEWDERFVPLLEIEDSFEYNKGPKRGSLLIAGYGFSWSNIHALDLFSYSPCIDIGDMHDMPYEDSTFDIVFSGWCLAYSADQPRALGEMVRVLKDGGIVAFGQGHAVASVSKSNSLDEIFAPIQDHIDTVYFRHEITPEMRDVDPDLTAIVYVFSIKKAEVQLAAAVAP